MEITCRRIRRTFPSSVVLPATLLLPLAAAACGERPADGAPALNAAWEWTALQGADRTERSPGERFAYQCPANGTPHTVWGTDIYTDDSSVCTAAVHAGKITFAEGGRVVFEIRPGQDTYEGSTRNGVTTQDYGSWEGSFVFP